MPQIDFYFSEDDFAKLTETIFARGMVAVPNCNYLTSNYTNLTSLKEFEGATKSCRQFFLTHQAFSFCPLEVRGTVGNDGKEFYYIMPRNGGPTIDLFWAGADTLHIKVGFLSHYPTYWNPAEETNLRAPKPLIQEYGKLAAFIRKHSEKISGPKRSVYLGPHAKQLRDRGAVLVGWDDIPTKLTNR